MSKSSHHRRAQAQEKREPAVSPIFGGGATATHTPPPPPQWHHHHHHHSGTTTATPVCPAPANRTLVGAGGREEGRKEGTVGHGARARNDCVVDHCSHAARRSSGGYHRSQREARDRDTHTRGHGPCTRTHARAPARPHISAPRGAPQISQSYVPGPRKLSPCHTRKSEQTNNPAACSSCSCCLQAVPDRSRDHSKMLIRI